MISGLSEKEAAALALANRCGCGGVLAPCWGPDPKVRDWAVKCMKDPEHTTYRRKRTSRDLYNPDLTTSEFNVHTQQPVDIHEREGKMVLAKNPELNQTLAAPPAISTAPMTIAEFDQRMALIAHVAETMKPQIHYGIIPGTRDKSLWEPGAEYLRAAFNIAWGHEVISQEEDYTNWVFKYRIRAFQLLAPGVEGSSWVSSVDSRESKFLGMEKETLPNNVFDRGLKRAFVNLMKNVTGTSGYFKDAAPAADAQRLTFKCADHSKNFRRFEKGDRVWYSHREGEAWCNASQELIDRFEQTGLNTGGADAEEGTPPRQAAQGAPARSTAAPQTAKAPPTPGSQPQARRCTIPEHGGAGLLMHMGLNKRVHRLPDGRFCNGVDETYGEPSAGAYQPAGDSQGNDPQDEDDGPEGFPPSHSQDLEGLKAAVAAAVLTWQRFEADYLRMPWAQFEKLGGTVEQALARLKGGG